MSLRDLARELYRSQQQVERLEKLLLSAAPEEEDAIRLELQEARAERIQLQKMIDGRKDSLSLPRKF
jgi:vacuolar-type H+-ATPase subunit D/Vma8